MEGSGERDRLFPKWIARPYFLRTLPAPLKGEIIWRSADSLYHFLLQGISPTQESNLCLLHCRQILYQLSYEGILIM